MLFRSRANGETEREENRNNEIEEREISDENVNKIYNFFLEYCNNTILTLELYCSTIANFFAIVRYTIL